VQGREKTVLGWSEFVALPDWDIGRIRAKVDTGARTSALHVENLTHLPDGWVSFQVVAHAKTDRRHRVTTRVERLARVRSSTGQYTERCFVKTTLRIGPVEKEIEISLVSREKMQYRMLLGRTALDKDFVIDVGQRRVLTSKRRKPRQKRGE
jgi:hypothetical protein